MKREGWPCGNLLDGLDGREDATAQDEEVWLSIDMIDIIDLID